MFLLLSSLRGYGKERVQNELRSVWHLSVCSRLIVWQNSALLTLLFQPALLLIDFGHFQYNSIMLGLTLHALNLFALGHDLWGAVFFVLSLCFKQMALYYAPGVGTYLLVKCIYLGKPEGQVYHGLAFWSTYILSQSTLVPSSSRGHHFYFPYSIPAILPPLCVTFGHDTAYNSYFPLFSRNIRGQSIQLLVRYQRPHQVEILGVAWSTCQTIGIANCAWIRT